MHYSAYRLRLASDLALPELVPAGDAGGVPDVEIRSSRVASGGLPEGRQLGPFLWASPGQLWLHVPGIARFLVRDGRRIDVEPEPGADEDSVRVFLLGSALGALLSQRGLLVLHGNAVRIGDQCMVCVGPSGAGKSTLAAGFLRRGHEVLADDVVAVDAQCRALPGFPRIKLWQDVADRLAIDTEPLQRIRPDMPKFNLPVPAAGDGEPLPIRWIYVLGSDHVDDFRFEPIQGMQRFMPLRQNTYRVRFLEGMVLKAEHLRLCGQLAGRVRLARVTRPRLGFALDAMVDRLAQDMADHP